MIFKSIFTFGSSQPTQQPNKQTNNNNNNNNLLSKSVMQSKYQSNTNIQLVLLKLVLIDMIEE